MSVLSRGSRTKLKQLNGRLDGTTLESHLGRNQDEQDLSTKSSPSRSMTPPMASPNLQTLSHTVEPVTAALPVELVAHSQINNRSDAHTTEASLKTAIESDRDDRSSSLSDLEDRQGHNNGNGQNQRRSFPPVEEDDTEAETERLEESPQKLRKHQNVVLGATNELTKGGTAARGQSPNQKIAPFALDARIIQQILKRSHDGPEDEVMDQISDISSLDDTAEETSRPASPRSVSGKKRKRSSHGAMVENNTSTVRSLKRAALDIMKDAADAQVRLEVPELDPNMKNDMEVDRVYEEDELSVDGGEIPNDLLQPRVYKKKKRSRFNKREGANGIERDQSRSVSPGIGDAEINDGNDAEESVGEDADLEDVMPGMETEVPVRNEEEVMKKKAALDSLGAIEKQFATLRDRLYEERMTQLNEELAMLNQPTPTHSDYLAMLECIDQRRDEKISQAKIRIQYKLECLQRRAFAERAIAHGQYMQTIRATRDDILEQANKEWYQIQRERRSCDDEDEHLYLYQFSTHRPGQIVRQTAYNTEVSILSGIAKYNGFPAAPEITGAKFSEIEEDLRKIGSTPQIAAIRMAASLSNLSRQRPAAEEQFLEQNAWANPHHPVHHQNVNALQRQLSFNSRPLSPFTTPAAQRRMVDISVPTGSASTIAAPQSAPNSSVVPTPSSIEHNSRQTQSYETAPYRDGDRDGIQVTPSNRKGYIEQGDPLPTIATKSAKDSGSPQPSMAFTGISSVPGSAKVHSNNPIKSHDAGSPANGPSSHDTLPSTIRNEDQQGDTLGDSIIFRLLHSQLPRQLSVGAGVEHGSS